MAINKVILVGNMAADPEIRTTQNNISVASFSVAVNRPRSKSQAAAGQQAEADFIDCTAWRGTADLVGRYFRKGSPIGITGRLQKDSWTDQQGQRRYRTLVVVDEVSFVGRKSDNQGGQQTYAQPQQGYAQSQYQQPQQSAPVTPMNNGYQQGGYTQPQPQYQQQPAQQVGMNYDGGFAELDADEDLPF